MRNPTRGKDKAVQAPFPCSCPFIYISWYFSTVTCKTIYFFFLLPKNKRTLTSSDDNSTSERKQIKLKLKPSLPLYSTVAVRLSAKVAFVVVEFFKCSSGASEMGKEGSVWYNRVLNCLIRRKIKRWKKSKIRKGGERGILREARRGRELVTWKDVGRRMEERSNLTSGF